MNWGEVGGWIKNNAGTGAALVGSMLTGNLPGAVAAGISMVASATGTDDPQQALAAMQADPETLVKLKQIAFDNESSIRLHIESMAQIKLEEEKVRISDTANAREIHKGHWMPPLMTLIITGMFSVMIYVLTHISIPDANRDVVYILIGMLVQCFGIAFSYWLGTSRSSFDKHGHLMRGKK